MSDNENTDPRIWPRQNSVSSNPYMKVFTITFLTLWPASNTNITNNGRIDCLNGISDSYYTCQFRNVYVIVVGKLLRFVLAS